MVHFAAHSGQELQSYDMWNDRLQFIIKICQILQTKINWNATSEFRNHTIGVSLFLLVTLLPVGGEK